MPHECVDAIRFERQLFFHDSRELGDNFSWLWARNDRGACRIYWGRLDEV